MIPKNDTDCGRNLSQLELTFQRLKTPLDKFIHYDAASGLLLMGCAILALLLANTSLATAYDHIRHTVITLQLGSFTLSHTLHHWINDGLMALFFFLVGLEIKREILVGELACLRQALLPIGAAIGGMIVPALFYAAINKDSIGAGGWAIPMATDIAFAVGVLVLLGKRVPKSLFGFLLALAIVDDLGAILIIAFFYTKTIDQNMLIWAAFIFFLLIGCNRVGIRKPLPYFLLGGLLWLTLLNSGIHATLAGVLTALTVPANPRCHPSKSIEVMSNLLTRLDKVHEPDWTIVGNTKAQGVLQNLEDSIHNMASPLQRLELHLHPWSAFLIIPLFALANTGIPIEFSSLTTTLRHPVTLGVMGGLVAGKAIGVFTSVWLLQQTRISRLPSGINLHHIAGISLLAGIGFTMSIFIGELSFAGQENLLLQAKTGVLVGSLLAGISGFLWLYVTGRPSRNL
ncbi:MAG: Na+/H+ antiporter NhaA [Pseudomonadota bacterium]